MTITRARTLEAAAVFCVLAAGIWAGAFSSRHVATAPAFYQEEFGPSVMVASGRGFVNPQATPGSPLAEFLAVRRSTLDRADLRQVSTGAPTQPQQAERYLMLLVGVWWSITGISWPALSGVSALMYGLTVAACYAICRLCLPRLLSAAGAVFVAISPMHLREAPNLRNYVKAPFILLAIPLIVLVALRPMSRRRLALLSAACGLVIGIGIGFKMDVLIMAPIFLVSLVGFRGRRPWTDLTSKSLAAGAFLLALTVTAGPIVYRLSAGGSNAFHVILLGYAEPFDASLGTRPSVYRALPFYSDLYVWEAVNEHAGRTNAQQVIQLTTAPYAAATRAYWMQIARHFPADVLTRALGASNAVLNLPFNQPPLDFLNAPFPLGPRVRHLFDVVFALNGWGLVFGAVLIGAASAHDPRSGLITAWLLLAVTGYASLQFHERHVFHLEIIGVLAALLTLRLVIRTSLPSRVQVQRFSVTIAGLAATVATLLVLLRAYQSVHVATMLDGYIDAPRRRVEPTFADTGSGTWRMRWEDGLTTSRPPAADYYVMEFDGATGADEGWFALRYQDVSLDYASLSPMWNGGGVARVFVPAYGTAPRPFQGVELSSALKRRLRSVSRIEHPERLPLLLTLRLPDAWRQQRLYETLRAEHPREVDAVPLSGDPSSTAQSRIAWLDRFTSPAVRPASASVETVYLPDARVADGRIEMNAVAPGRSAYLLGFRPVDVRGPGAVLVKGHLDAGGLAFGVLKGGQWYRQAQVRARGDFVVVVQIPESGSYTPLITNATAGDGERTSFVLSHFGVVDEGLR